MRHLLALLALLIASTEAVGQGSFGRGISVAAPPFKVPLATDGLGLTNGVGQTWRDADHATVAMNSDLDIAVAFHSSRGDINSDGLKQVEVAYFEYDPGTDMWDYLATRLVGSVDYNPLASAFQTAVKCERPDIIAVGNRFFVTWTRRYSDNYAGQDNHPAVLECAWVERGALPTTFEVHGVPGQPGLGHILQKHVPGTNASLHFEILDCAGAPDAVTIKDSSLPTTTDMVGVVYPHQWGFADPNDPVEDQDRSFELRLVTCRFDSVTSSITHDAPIALHTNLQFNGPKGLNGTTSAGLILPDLAPSAEEKSFWVAAEHQVMVGPTGSKVPHGVVKLQYWSAGDPTIDGPWEAIASKTYLSTGASYQSRRRPNLSSYPPATPAGTPQSVSIAFNQAEAGANPPDPSLSVIHEEWEYSAGSISAPSVPTMNAWPNSSSYDDHKPVPLRGRDSPYVRKCYATRAPYGASLPKDMLSHNAAASVLTTLQTIQPPDTGELTRPAVAYQNKVVPNWTGTDHIAVAFEGEKNGTARRIRIGVE